MGGRNEKLAEARYIRWLVLHSDSAGAWKVRMCHTWVPQPWVRDSGGKSGWGGWGKRKRGMGTRDGSRCLSNYDEC